MKRLINVLFFALKSVIFAPFITHMKGPDFFGNLLAGACMALAFEAVMIAGRAPFQAASQRLYKKHGRQGLELAILLALVPASLALMPLVKLGAFLAPVYFPVVKSWLTALSLGAVLLFTSGALAAWLKIPFITLDWTLLFKQQPDNSAQ